MDEDEDEAPEAWRAEPPARLALIRRIAILKGQPPDRFDENSRLTVLGATLAEMMYAIATLQRECAVRLPMSDLNRLNTLGELADLVRRSPKVESVEE